MKVELTLGKNSKSVDVKAEIVNIVFNPVSNFTPFDFHVLIPQYEYVQINYNVTITIEESIWVLPYLILLRKGLNDAELEKYNYIDKNNILFDEKDARIDPNTIDKTFDFIKIRAINIPLCEIENKNHLEFLIHFLYRLDLNKSEKITHLLYSSISTHLFYHKNDLNSNIEYCIKRFKNVSKSDQWHFEHPGNWFMPYVNLKDLKFEDEIMDRHLFFCNKLRCVIEGNVMYNVLPFNYICSYSNDFKDIQNRILYNSENSEVVFKGTYEECQTTISDQETLKKFIRSLILKDCEKEGKINQNSTDDYFNNSGWERDTFHAMTDGQFGSYDDFNGSLDDIVTRTRG